MKKPPTKLKDFRQQKVNANKHTQRGMGILENSMQDLGYTAPMIAAADGEIIDGSARHETAANVFGSDVEPIVVESDGKRPIVVRRTDIKNGSTKLAKQISIAANRVAQVNLEWDGDNLRELLAGLDDSERIKLALAESDLRELNVAADAVEPKPEGAGFNYVPQFGVIVVCENEQTQQAAYEKLLGLGYNCKVVVT